jgi:hypothetical protein
MEPRSAKSKATSSQQMTRIGKPIPVLVKEYNPAASRRTQACLRTGKTPLVLTGMVFDKSADYGAVQGSGLRLTFHQPN